MALYVIKTAGRSAVRPLMKVFGWMHPNAITWLSLVFATAAGYALYRADLGWPLLVAPVLILIRSGCNLLDGMVAIQKQMTSVRGEALQDVVDRLSDVVTLLGVTFSPFGSLALGILACAAMLVSSYVGILKKAVGGQREYGGILGKVDRFALVSAFSVLQYFWTGRLYGLTAFGLLLGAMVLGGMVTTIQRGLSIRRLR
jgi:archaetidylinositol phosphate synthase